MQKTKVIIAFVVAAALVLAAVGLAAAQIAQNQTQTYTGAESNSVVSAEGFWGWIGDCFGYRASQGQYFVPPVGVNATAIAPYQGGYGPNNGYGYGPCWVR